MSMTGLEAFDSTIQKTNIWLKDIMKELGTEDKHRAYIALRAVLHTLRDCLPPGELAEFGAQFPLLIRGVYYEGWKPGEGNIRQHHKRSEFLNQIQGYFPSELDLDPETVTSAVFTVLSMHLAPGEIEDVKALLPRDLKELWPHAVAV